MAIKILYFDTNAIVKYFVNELGSEIIRWIVENRIYKSFHINTSKQAINEFPSVIMRIADRGDITKKEADRIIRNADLWFFKQVFHIRDEKEIPNFRFGENAEYNQLIQKYNLITDYNDWDIYHIMCVINYLRIYTDISTTRVVTSDNKFIKIIIGEGYPIINPEKVTIEEVDQMLQKIPSVINS